MINENKITGLVITIWALSMVLGIISIHYVRQNTKLKKKNEEWSAKYYTMKNNYTDLLINSEQKIYSCENGINYDRGKVKIK